MIDFNVLKESIFESSYFTESSDTLTIHNENETRANTLLNIKLLTSGKFINISNDILKEGSGIYRKLKSDWGCISFRRDCDGICFLQLGERNILLIIEIKSGFNEVKNKAFEQLVISYLKTRCTLQTIKGYNPTDYEEIGLVISYPPSVLSSPASATSVIEVKKEIIIPTELDRLNAKNATQLRVDNEVTLNMDDYQFNVCHVNPAFFNASLLVKYISVNEGLSSETINLDTYL